MTHKNYWNLLDLNGYQRKLRYLHGIEMEYFLLDKDLNPVKNNKNLMDLVEKVFPFIKNKLKNNKTYQRKVRKIGIADNQILKERSNKRDAKKIKTIFLKYKQDSYATNEMPIDIVGKDTNVGTGGFITLELVTPPCCNIKELTWWVKTLIKSSKKACKELNLNFILNAGHPKIENNFCGEHHHIGILNEKERLKIYNLSRLFIPLLSILSYSHFQKTNNVNIDLKDDLFQTKISNQFIRGTRLKKTNQIKPVAPLKNLKKEEFSKKIGLNQYY